MTERECTRAQTETQAEPESTVGEVLEIIPTETREGRRDAKALCDADYFLREGREMLDAWLASLSANFDFVPTDAEQKLAIQFFIERNLSFLDRRSYDQCRKVLVARGIFPERCLTSEDIAANLVESSPSQTFAEKQELKRKLSMLNQR
jgi:hypothetical protein